MKDILEKTFGTCMFKIDGTPFIGILTTAGESPYISDDRNYVRRNRQWLQTKETLNHGDRFTSFNVLFEVTLIEPDSFTEHGKFDYDKRINDGLKRYLVEEVFQ